MAANAATLQIGIEVDDKGSVKIRDLGKTSEDAGNRSEKGLGKANRTLGDMDALSAKAAATLRTVAVAGAAIGAAAVLGGIYALTGALRESVALASDMQEVQSKFEVVFGELAGQAEQWSIELVDSYHMSELASKQYLAAMQDLLVPMGMNSEAAAKMSFEVVKLSADLGSFNNVPTAQVMDDIQSALVGNYETMKKYGVVINATTVQEKALAMGLAETKDALTAADKAQAAYTMILEGSSAALGDSIRTSGSYANQMKDLQANLEGLKIVAGEALLPVLTDIVTETNAWLKENKELLKHNITDFVSKLVPVIEATAAAIKKAAEFTDNWIEGAKILGWIEDKAAKQRSERIIQLKQEIKGNYERMHAETLSGETRLLNAKLYYERTAELNELLGESQQKTELLGDEAAITGGKIEDGFDQGTAAINETKDALSKTQKEIYDTGQSYDVMVADWVMGTDPLTQNIVDTTDLLEGEFKDATDYISGPGGLQEGMVNDLGRIFDDYFNQVLTGQIDSVEDLFEGLFSAIWDMFSRLLSQIAANSLVDLIFGSGSSGGLTIQGLFGGSGGGSGGSGLFTTILGAGYEAVMGESFTATMSELFAPVAEAVSGWFAADAGYGGYVAGQAQIAELAAAQAAQAAASQSAGYGGYIAGQAQVAELAAAEAAQAGGSAATPSMAGTLGGAAGFAGVAAFGAFMTYQMATRDKTKYHEWLNKAGITPDYFADAIGDTFVESIDPIYGKITHTMMNAESNLLTQVNAMDETFASQNIFNELTGKWESVNQAWMMFMDHSASETDRLAYAMETEFKTGIEGMAESMMASSELMRTDFDRLAETMRDAGVSGVELKTALELAETALDTAGGTTAELEGYLRSLGTAEEDIALITSQLSPALNAASVGMGLLDVAASNFTGSASETISGFNGITTVIAGPNGLNTVLGNLETNMDAAKGGVEDFAYSLYDLANNLGDDSAELPGTAPPPAAPPPGVGGGGDDDPTATPREPQGMTNNSITIPITIEIPGKELKKVIRIEADEVRYEWQVRGMPKARVT